MDLKEQMERIYQELAPDEIPWNLEGPPAPLAALVESRWVLPCDTVDLGCGAGNHAVWLATKGFRVTGVDISPRALELAERLAAESGIACRFVESDLTKEDEALDDYFDFAYDWEVLHHIFPVDRGRYVSNVHRMLRPAARYLSICFSEEDAPGFGGEGKYVETSLGTTLYLSSERELQALFEPKFHIEGLRTMEVDGKHRPHVAIEAMMIKRD